MSLLAGLSHRGEYPQAVLAEFEALMVALKQAWATDTLLPGMSVIWYDPANIPAGWALHNGQSVLRKDNPLLTEMSRLEPTMIGPGDGVTTITLPNDGGVPPPHIIRLG